MPQFAEVIYNPYAAYVAALNLDNTYGTPVQIDYLGKLSFQFEHDQDELMSGGQIVEKMSIAKKATGELTQGAMNFAALAIMIGETAADYGVTPSQYSILDARTGGSGMPYFGLIVAYAATNGANMLAGFPKAMLQTVPGFDVDQNKFRIGSANFDAVPPSQNVRKVVRMRRYETAASIPTTANAFLDFFSTPINMFA